MPGKRPVKKGSFGSHFDEVVKHFPDEESDMKADKEKTKGSDAHNVHDRLFESGWSRARAERYGRLA